MGNRGQTRYSFASSFTGMGFRTFIPELMNGVRKVFILKGAPGTGKSTFIRLVGEALSQQGYDVEYWVSSLDPVGPDGVCIPQLGAAVINGSLTIPVDPQYPQVRDILINLGEYSGGGIAAEDFRAVTELLDCIRHLQDQAVTTIRESTEVKEELRRLNQSRLDMDAIQGLIDHISEQTLDYRPAEKHYFARVLTPDGMADYIDDLSRDCRLRYIFRGPAGSGGELVIEEVIRRARQKGYAMDYYHCGSEADRLVMVIIRNLQVALIEADQVDAEPRQGDTVVDMQRFLDIDLSDPSCAENSETLRHYERLLLKAQQELVDVQRKTRAVKKYYSEPMDFERLDEKRREVIKEILTPIDKKYRSPAVNGET